ncbi:MAG: hypothetical protein ACI80P_001349 [Flavobacteriales bacterium]|jgi:hypothetical protein
MKYLILLMIGCGISTNVLAQSNALQIELEAFSEVQQKYRNQINEAYNSEGEIDPESIPTPPSFTRGFFYPSVIRTLNIGQEPMINEFSKTIDLLIIGRCDNMTSSDEFDFFNRMTAQLKLDAYEVWIEMEGNERGSLLVKEDDGLITSFVLIFDSIDLGGLMVLDYVGEMTPEMLFELKNVDVEKLTKSLDNSMLKNFLDL